MSAYTKRVSVIMPVRNGAATIEHALTSVLSELTADDELIVVDDRSIDCTRSVVEEFGERVTWVPNSGSGIVDGLNTGLRYARGTYVARCDADDTWLADRLDALIDALESHADAAACFGSAILIDEQGNHRGVQTPPIGHQPLRSSLLRRNVLVHGAVLARHSVVETVGGYRDYAGAEDYDLWLRLLRQAPIVTISQPVYVYRLSHPRLHARKRHVQARSSLRILLNHARLTGEFSLPGLLRNALSAVWPTRRFWYRA